MVKFKSTRIYSGQTILPDSNNEITKNITRFLKLLYVTGFTRNSNHEIVKSHSKAELCLALMIALTCNFGSLYLRIVYKLYPDNMIPLLWLNIMYTATELVNTVCLICRNFWLDIDVYTIFYKHYHLIDSIINIKEKYYQNAKLKATVFFYTMSVSYIAVRTAILVLIGHIAGTMRIVPFLNSEVSSIISQLALMYLLIKVLIFKSKFSAYTERVLVDVSVRNRVWEVNRPGLTNNVIEYKKCYQLFVKQYELLQRTEAFFAVRPIVCVLVLSIETVVNINLSVSQTHYIGEIVTRLYSTTFLFASYGLLIAIACHVERIAKIRTKLQLHLEAVIAHRVMDASERKVVVSLTEQLCRQPLHFSVYGRIPLNYHLLHMIISAVITYTVVFLQLMK